MNRTLALVLLCSPLLGSEAPRTEARLKPDLAPTAAAAAELVGQEAADALSGRGATAALVVKGRRVASAVSDAFVAALVRAGIEARCGSAPLFPSLKPRNGPPLVRLDCTKSDGERRVTVSLPAPFDLTFEQRHGDAPWVVAADAAADEQGVALLPDGDSGQRCVGRSDPCSSLSEASAEARSRLERSVQTAALATLAARDRQRAAPRGLVRRVLAHAGIETFESVFTVTEVSNSPDDPLFVRSNTSFQSVAGLA